jgi:hypothetical protein
MYKPIKKMQVEKVRCVYDMVRIRSEITVCNLIIVPERRKLP